MERQLQIQVEARVRDQIAAQQLATNSEDSSADQTGALDQSVASALQNPAVPQHEQSTSTPPIPTSATLEQPVRTDQHPTEAQPVTNEPSIISQRCPAGNRMTQQSVETPADGQDEDPSGMLTTIRALNEITNSPAVIQSPASGRNNRALLKRSLPSSTENSLARNRERRQKKNKH